MNKSQDLTIIRTLPSRNYPLYIVRSDKKNATYVMKTFPYKESSINTHFLYERRFYWLKHPHIISQVDFSSKHTLPEKMKGPLSYILLELAPYGNLGNMLVSRKLPNDEKFARTLFH
jgi:hypothetical protein